MIKSAEQLRQILENCDFGKPYELPPVGSLALPRSWFRNKLPSCRSHRWKIYMKKLRSKEPVPHWTETV